MASGGPRVPTKPAVVSGPGSLSQRTDGGPASKQAARYIAGGDYGSGGLMGIQQGAPMAASPTPSVPTSSPQSMPQANPSQPVIPLTAPSQRPNEPVTSGAASGAGPGPETLNPSAQTAQNQYLVNSLSLLNQLGNFASPQVKQIRSAIAAHLNNQSGS